MRLNIDKIKTFIKSHSHFVIATHKNPDGDALASALMMAVFLRKMKKKFRIVNQNSLPNRYEFFLDRYINYMVPEFIRVPEQSKFNVVLNQSFRRGGLIVLDSSNLKRVGHFAEDLEQFSSVLNIDHHGDNSKFGTLNLINSKASATAEILYELIKKMNLKMPLAFYELAYIGLSTDTGFFSQPNTTSKTLKIFSELLVKKIDVVILNKFLRQQKMNFLKLTGMVLSRLQSQAPLAWSYFSLTDLKKSELNLSDTESVTEIMAGIQDVPVIIVFKQMSKAKVKISFRSKPGYGVLNIAQHFGGGGHENAAGCEIKGGLKEVVDQVVKFALKYYDKLEKGI